VAGEALMATAADTKLVVLVPQWVSQADQARLNKYEFSIDKADALMKDAGYADHPDVRTLR
jgi:hypothetical protein